MKRFVLFVLVVLCVGSLLSGCGSGMVHSQQERARRYKICNDLYARQLIDDWDYVALNDRPSYLTEWPIRDTD